MFVLLICLFTKVLALLCVHPDCERRGAGSAIVQWGLNYAERVALPAYLEASKAGQPVYERLGFKQIDEIVVPAEKWDGDFDRHYAVMLKNPWGKNNVTAVLVKEVEVQAD
jgi:N-acetylglutamate synthase-like GNAT family acetyltransferase